MPRKAADPRTSLPKVPTASDDTPLSRKAKDLLEKTANRRVSMLPNDAPAEVDAATSPKLINNANQLKHWVRSDCDAVLNLIKEYRQERDMALQCVEEWNVIAVERDQALNYAANAQERAKEAKEAARRMKGINLDLSDQLSQREDLLKIRDAEITSLKEQLLVADMQNDDNERRRRERSRSRTRSSVDTEHSKKSPKVSNPPVLTDGIEPTFIG